MIIAVLGILSFFALRENSNNIVSVLLIIFLILGLNVFIYELAFESMRKRLNKLEEQKKESE
jgi:ABC-type uncharacterized transport system permease subunit